MEKLIILKDFFTNNNVLTIISLLTIFIPCFLNKIIRKTIFKIFFRFTTNLNDKAKENLINIIDFPIKLFIIISSIYISLLIFPYTSIIIKEGNISKLYISSIILIITIVIYKLFNINSIVLDKLEEMFKYRLEKATIILFVRFLKVLIVLIGITLILETWGYNTNTLVASLGVFSAVLALAAKDYLTNVFSGLIIVIDKPFSIGDYIETVEGIGIVEDITFRTTKIRTFEKAILTIPNAKLSSNSISNYSRRDSRKVTFTIGVSYDTSIEQIERVVPRIRNMLLEKEEIDNETIICNFDGFGDSSLNIFLNFYINKSEWSEYLNVKEQINISILKIMSEEKVEIAFPTQTLYIKK